jgi:Mycobacterium membrane protein
MGVPAAAPSAKLPEPGGTGKLKLVSTTVVAAGVIALVLALAVQVMPQDGRPVTHGQGQAAASMAERVADAVPSVTHSVVYELLGDEGVRNITYVADGAAIAQQRTATTPWTKSLQRTGAADENQFYSVTAQNAGRGTLRCRITVDGQVISDESVSGDQTMVTCAK